LTKLIGFKSKKRILGSRHSVMWEQNLLELPMELIIYQKWNIVWTDIELYNAN
jgi:hypothetical protein